MFPLHDENPHLRAPVVTILLVVVTCAAWLLVQGAGADVALARSVCELGLIPGEITGRAHGVAVELGPGVACVVGGEPRWLTTVSSIFLHGGWLHLIGNMWFLWVFGNNVEDSMGRLRYLAFYLICGLAAGGAQVLADPGSPVPMIGASGAVSGVMGAYVVLYPRVRVKLLIFLGIFITTINLPAYVVLGYWFVLQILGGLPRVEEAAGGVAFWAHVGGFVAGAVLIWLFRNPALVEQHRRHVASLDGDGAGR